MKNDLLSKFVEIKIFLFDLEGVLLNHCILEERCVELIEKACLDFKMLGLMFGIVTARKEDSLIQRLKSLDSCFVLAASLDKVSLTDEFLNMHSVEYKNVFFMGDDLFDIPLLIKCGISCAPGNARREVKRVVSFVAKSDQCDELLKEIISYYQKSKEVAAHATK